MPLDLLASKLINCSNRKFVIHSDLTIFGRNLPKYKGVAIRTFRQKLNAEVLAIPTFNLHTNSSNIVDFSTFDYSMGALPIEALAAQKDTDSIRLPNPIHSYSFFPHEISLKKIDCAKSFGKNSVFDYFYENDFLWLEFGTYPEDGLTIFHHLEYLAAVPYREEICFDRSVRFNGQEYNVNYKYFARKDNSYAQNFNRAINYLLDKNIFTLVTYKSRRILFGSVQEISLAILDKLTSNPYFLVDRVLK